MKITLRLLSFLKPYMGMVLISILTGSATIVSGIGLFGASAYLLSMAALQPSISILQVAIVGVRFFGLSRGILRYLERLSSHSVNLQVLSGMRVWIYKALVPLAPARLQGYQSGDLLTRVVADIDTLENFYVRVFAPLVTAFIITAGMGIFIGSFDPALGGVLVIGLLISSLGLPGGLRVVSRQAGGRLADLRGRLSGEVVELSQGVGELTLLGHIGQKVNGILMLGAQLGEAQMRLSQWSGLANGLLIFLNGFTVYILLRIALPLVEVGRLDGVGLAVIILGAIASFEVTAPLIPAGSQFETSLAAARRLFQLADTSPVVTEPDQPLPIPARKDLSLQHVRLTYEGREQNSLDDFSLEMTAGQRIAIVGESGAGKTSLIQLLLRFWEKSSGQIRLGGVGLEELKPEEVRSQFSLVPSDGWIFHGSLRENLRIARNSAEDDACWKALSLSGLEAWAGKLPAGLNSIMGERGVNLSLGERQRLMVARAILQDAPIYLLDEPTNGLDSITEQAVMKTLLQVTEGRSSLWMMHRLIDLEKMDEIIVLSEGRIIERGTFCVLMERQGPFRRMMELLREMLIER